LRKSTKANGKGGAALGLPSQISSRERLATLVSFQGVVSRHHNAKNKFRQFFPQISRLFRYLRASSPVVLVHPERSRNEFEQKFSDLGREIKTKGENL
jgi:hypothetical protein